MHEWCVSPISRPGPEFEGTAIPEVVSSREARQMPGAAVAPGQHPIGFNAIGDLLRFRVPRELLPGAECDVPQETSGGAAVADFDIAGRQVPGLDAVEKIAHMGQVLQ